MRLLLKARISFGLNIDFYLLDTKVFFGHKYSFKL